MSRPLRRSRHPVTFRSGVSAEVLEVRTLMTAYVVDTLADAVAADGKLSLREAIRAANDNAAVNEAPAGQAGDFDTITSHASLDGGTIVLADGQLSISGRLRIAGPGADRLSVSGGGRSRVFSLEPGGYLAEISGVTITGGRTDGSGGAITNSGHLTLRDCDVSGNVADGYGGGIDTGLEGGELVVLGCLISGNVAGHNGGGISNFGGTATIHNSTLSGNRAAEGGGFFNRFNDTGDRLDIRNATIFGNSGGGVYHLDLWGTYPDLPTMRSTIVAGNVGSDGRPPDDVFAAYLPFDPFRSRHNLIGDAATAGGMRNGYRNNVVGVDWRTVLDPVLRDNGGPTRTHRLLPGSRAIDAGLTDASTPGPYDQRGAAFARRYGAGVDIGAYEVGPADDLIGYLAGSWTAAASTGAAFVTSERARWNDVAWTALRQGDFDGDGLTDVLGLFAGEWYVGRSTGTAFATSRWGKWQNVAWEHVLVGDVNNDGRDDVVAEVGGQWWAALSTGTTFGAPTRWAGTSDAAWDAALLSDVTGESRDDLVLVLGGDWYVGVAITGRFAGVTRWARWGNADYRLLTTADLDLDGRADAVAFAGGEWRVGLADENGTAFGNTLRAKWASATWLDPVVGDFDGDGRADVAARFGGQWYVGLTHFTGAEASRALWAVWQNVAWKDVRVGDFDGDGRGDVAGRINGQWYVGRGTGGGFETTLWGAWAEGAWRAVAAADAGWAPAAAASAAAFDLSPARVATFAVKDEEPLARFWSRAEEDEEFGRRLAVV